MDSNSSIRKAIHHARRGNKRLAERVLRQVIAKCPNHADAWYYLAAVVKTRRESIQCLQNAIKFDPEHSRAKKVLAALEASPGEADKLKRSGVRVWMVVVAATIFLFFIGFFIFSDLSTKSTDIAPSLTATSMISPTARITPTVQLSPISAKSTARAIPFSTALPTPDYPPSARISNITGQKMRISLDCESNSAVIFASFFGKKLDEVEFFLSLPVSDNPDKGYVGDVHDEWGGLPPQGYGVYPAPVVELLAKKGVTAKAVYGFTFDELKREIAANRPVIVWVVGRVENGEPEQYISSDGETHIVARFQHTVLVIGYDAWGVTVLDGEMIYARPTDLFLSSWDVLGNMAIIKITE